MTDIQLGSLLIGFIITSIFLRVLRPVAYHFDLLDEPCSRKQHCSATPLLGGVCVFIGVLAALAIGVDGNLQVQAFLLAGALMVLLGVVDDKYDVSAKARLAGQVLIATLLIFLGDMQFTTVGNLLGFGELQLGWSSLPFTYLAILAAINAFNMIDGIDGLLGGAALLSFAAIGVLAGLHNATLPMYVALVIAMALVPFMMANLGFHGMARKVFMGDSGSMFIGLAIIWLLIFSTQGHFMEVSIKPVTALWLVALPVMDIVTVMLSRMIKKTSPLKAGRDHIHHHYLRAGFSSRQTLMALLGIAFFMQVVGAAADLMAAPEVLMLGAFFIAYFTYLLHIKWLISRSNCIE